VLLFSSERLSLVSAVITEYFAAQQRCTQRWSSDGQENAPQPGSRF
jgi:hypothetical protein